MMPARGSSHGLIDNFYLSKDELLHDTPSRRAGVDAETEAQLRNFGCERIQLGVLYLKLPQVVAATGQVLLHRFYCKQSMTDFDVKRVAIAAMWLASKLEEAPKKFRDVLLVFARIDSRAEGRAPELLDPFSQRFEHLKQEVFRIEKSMLRAFGFVTHVEHPHKFVLSLLNILDLNDLQQEAWNLTNDSLRTTLCVRFKSEVVACGIIFLAARRKQVVMPENVVPQDGSPGGAWWDLCSVTLADVVEVATEINALYSLPPAKYVALGRAAAAPGASGPRVSSLAAAAASPISVPPSPQGAPAASGGNTGGDTGGGGGGGGEGSAAAGLLPNGGEASGGRRPGSGDDDGGDGDAGGDVAGASGGRSDSRGQAVSGPDRQARDAAQASGGRSRSASEEAERPSSRRRGSRSAERSDPRSRGDDRARDARDSHRNRHRDSSRGARDRDSGRDGRDGRDESRRDRADSRGVASERTSNGYREDRRHDERRSRDGGRDSRERGRDREATLERDSEARRRDRGEYERKRDRPVLPADSDSARKRSRPTPPEDRPGSRLSGRAGSPALPPPPPPTAAKAAAARDAGPSRDGARPGRPDDARIPRPRPGPDERDPAKDRLGHRPSSCGGGDSERTSKPAEPERGGGGLVNSERSSRGGERISFRPSNIGSAAAKEATDRVVSGGKRPASVQPAGREPSRGTSYSGTARDHPRS